MSRAQGFLKMGMLCVHLAVLVCTARIVEVQV